MSKKGLTLMEISVVCIIVGVLATIAVPAFNSSIESGKSVDAKNVLLSIYAAQKSYFANTNTYCTDTGGLATCLGVTIPGTSVTYSCPATAVPATSGSVCTATLARSGGNMVYTIDVTQNIGLTGCTNPICGVAASAPYTNQAFPCSC